MAIAPKQMNRTPRNMRGTMRDVPLRTAQSMMFARAARRRALTMTDRFDPLPAAGPRSAPPCAFGLFCNGQKNHANCAKPVASFLLERDPLARLTMRTQARRGAFDYVHSVVWLTCGGRARVRSTSIQDAFCS